MTVAVGALFIAAVLVSNSLAFAVFCLLITAAVTVYAILGWDRSEEMTAKPQRPTRFLLVSRPALP